MKYLYTESDWVAEVEVIRDNSSIRMEQLTLKVAKTLQSPKKWKCPDDGEVFKVYKDKSTYSTKTVYNLLPLQ